MRGNRGLGGKHLKVPTILECLIITVTGAC